MSTERVKCAMCTFEGFSLISHVPAAHGVSLEEYREVYPGPIVADSVDKKRKATSLERHGDANYRNKEAQKLSFEVYEGGHPMRDPEFVEAYKERRKLHGKEYDHASARETTRKNHGVDHYSQTDKARSKSRESMKALIASGRANCGKNKKECPDVEGFRKMAADGVLIKHICDYFGVSDVTLGRWFKEYDVPRRGRSQGNLKKDN